jgi:hypothetical protein
MEIRNDTSVIRWTLRWAAALAMMVSTAGAQTTASIFGTVTDESGAVIVGATIRATNTLTNETRVVASNDLGYYSLPELPVGMYTVSAELEGFKTAVREGIEL